MRNTLAIVITNLLKQDLTFSSNAFYRPYNADFASTKAFLVIISSGGNSDSDSDSTSACGSNSSSKILSWTGKYKLEAIAKQTEHERLLFSATFTAKFELVFILIHENALP